MKKAITILSVLLAVVLTTGACTGKSPASWSMFGGQGITVNVDVYGKPATGGAATVDGEKSTANPGGVIVNTDVSVTDGGTDLSYKSAEKSADKNAESKETSSDAKKQNSDETPSDSSKTSGTTQNGLPGSDGKADRGCSNHESENSVARKRAKRPADRAGWCDAKTGQKSLPGSQGFCLRWCKHSAGALVAVRCTANGKISGRGYFARCGLCWHAGSDRGRKRYCKACESFSLASRLAVHGRDEIPRVQSDPLARQVLGCANLRRLALLPRPRESSTKRAEKRLKPPYNLKLNILTQNPAQLI